MATPVEIAVRTTGTAEAERALGRVQSKVGSAAKTLGKTAALGAAVAAAAMVKLGADSVKSASAAEQSIGATRTVFGKYAQDVIRDSNKAAKAVGLSANEYRELANRTGAMLSGVGTPMKKTTELTEKLTKRAADMAATFGGTTREAVEAVGSLMRGEADPIERYGVSIKQSDVNARLAAKGLDGLTGSALKQAEQQARVSLLMESSAKSAGAFARESNTLAGQQQRLGAQFENIKAKIGTALLPVLTSAAQALNSSVLPAIKRLVPPAIELAKRFGAQLQPAIATVVGVFKTAAPVVLRLAKTAGSNLRPILDQLAKTVRGDVIPALQRVWPTVSKAAQILVQLSSKVAGTVLPVVIRLAGFVVSKLIPVIGGIVGAAVKAIGGLVRFGAAVINAGQRVAQFAAAVRAKISEAISIIAGLPGRISGALSGAGTWLIDTGRNIISGLVSGLESARQWVIDKIQQIADMIPDWVKRRLGIASPSRVMMKIGHQVVDGLIKGIKNGSKGVERVLSRLTDLIEKNTKAKRTKQLLRHYRDEYRALTKNARAQDRVTKRLREARAQLRELRKESRDYAANVKNAALSYAAVTNLDAAFNASAIAAAMRSRLDKLRQFSTLLAQLRAGGLNQATLEQLVQGGVEGGLAYADAIAAGGSDAIAEINALQQQVDSVSGDLGQTAADNMYAAGIQAAEGLIKGLQAKQRQLDRIAQRLARQLAKAIRRELGIKSPSRVFQDLGRQTVEGLRIGIEDGHARHIGQVLARDLTTGFSKPELTARQVWEASGGQRQGGNTHQITVEVPPGANKVAIGRELVDAINAFEQAGGKWTARR